ncbi:MAG: glucosaminidase domain-containing protein [Verrucomicrobiota bacterium]
MTPSDFIAAVAPAAQSSAAKTRIPASFTVAEAALESGWGSSRLAAEGFNLFGVKADRSWHGPTLTMHTREFVHCQWVLVPALWRHYPDWEGCIDDHAAFLLGNPRYRPAFAHTTGEDFARAVAAAGYATDPEYANKLCALIELHHLADLDKG